MTDAVAEVRRLLTRSDEVVKAAQNRSDPSVAFQQARILLKKAEDQLADLPEGEERDALVVTLGLRLDDVARLELLAADPSRARLDQPVAPDPMPTPGRETVERSMASVAERIPPHQRLVTSWPVLHVGLPPRVDLDSWKFAIDGLVERPVRLGWEEFRALPNVTLTSDFHCVTGWSRLDNTWEGVRFRDVADLAGVRPSATHVLVLGGNAYSANVDLEALMADDVLFAWSHDGRALPAEHGGPLRLVVPMRYAWKSAKWVEGIKFLDHDVAGYWEMRGYHNVADPWLEQRYG
ncbi:MAG TPA: sulfite oxidase-like oxidoreductase [Nitriliruptorales bacterium]